MTEYTVLLFRSGRVWVAPTYDEATAIDAECIQGDPPLLMASVIANSAISALGKLLLEYVDKASQPYQHIPICIAPCCVELCSTCGKPLGEHGPTHDNPYACP